MVVKQNADFFCASIALFALVNLIADLKFSVRALLPCVCASCRLLTPLSILQYTIAQLVFIPPGAAPAILGPRLILNLREAYYAPWAAELESANGTSPSGMRWPVVYINEPRAQSSIAS